MRGSLKVLSGVAVALAVGLSGAIAAGAKPRAHTRSRPHATLVRSSGAGSYILSATSTGGSYAPTFTGNGTLGVRVPSAGQGYAAGSVPAQSELAGFYAQPTGEVQQRANIPTWSTMTFTDGGNPFSAGAGTSGWRQSINLQTGVVTTTARWKAPDGHVTNLTYLVATDRARPNVGLVSLQLIPHWSGVATVTDEIDGTPATLTTQQGKGWNPSAMSDWVSVKTKGTAISATLASQLATGANVHATDTPVDQTKNESVGQRLTFPVSADHIYVIEKYVGVESSQTSNTTTAAQGEVASAAAAGFGTLLMENSRGWAALWKGRIDVLGDPTLATDVNASEFYLWSSIGDGVDWSISPAGLSSNGYNGHIFWDAETWMFPALLAQHPDLAAGINAYRYQRLGAAEQHAAATGYKGARFPWESAFDGTEQIPPPPTVNSEGLYEQHITADIALAQWQYYLATGDRGWLAGQGWPVLSQAAAFWASRVTRASDGSYHINGVTGPDEENPDVNDEVYTNFAAKTTLLDATQAAQQLGIVPPPAWAQIAAGLVVPTSSSLGIHPEFSTYQGQMVKQADVTLLQYPWSDPMSNQVAANDINYYVPRTDPGGPSMSDSVNTIDTSALGTPGCASYVYTERSYQPFIRDVFHQFSETRTGGAFTFMTGIGGFLQQFLYGYSGFRWSGQQVSFEPVLTSQLSGIVLHQMRWHQDVFTISIGPRVSGLTLLSGPSMTVLTRRGTRSVSAGRTLMVATRRPDLTATADRVRCQHATATSTQPGAPALAAVDGSPATDWQPGGLPASLTVPVSGGTRRIRTATLRWGQAWPPPPGPNVPPPPRPVTVVRPSSYQLLASANGHRWRVLETVSGRPTSVVDALRFGPVRARFIRVRITGSSSAEPPMLDELTVSG